MENQNPELNQTPTQVVENQNSSLQAKAIGKFKSFNFLSKFKNFKLNAKAKKILIIAAVLFILLLVLSILAPFIMKKIAQVTPLPEASPSPSPASTPEEILNPSVYADDPDILAIEAEINKLEEELKNSDLREDKLRLPNLDWDVSFKDE
jgi:hypothetical protein